MSPSDQQDTPVASSATWATSEEVVRHFWRITLKEIAQLGDGHASGTHWPRNAFNIPHSQDSQQQHKDAHDYDNELRKCAFENTKDLTNDDNSLPEHYELIIDDVCLNINHAVDPIHQAEPWLIQNR